MGNCGSRSIYGWSVLYLIGIGLVFNTPARAEDTTPAPKTAPQIEADAGKATLCGIDNPCAVTEGRYMVKLPAGWDGKTPLAAAVWFHGYQQSSTEIMQDSEFGQQFSREGVLLIVPDGRDKMWSFPSGPPAPTARDETAFIGAVIADAEKRFPIDAAHLFAAGFSIGATMVWTEACEVPTRFSAYVAFSGDFWDPPPQSCANGQVRLLQIHGTADTTFPIAGRKMRSGNFAQGNMLQGLDLWRKWKSCPQMASTAAPLDGLIATDTGACAGGSRIAFWQHTRGHEVDPAWVLASIRWVKSGWNETTH